MAAHPSFTSATVLAVGFPPKVSFGCEASFCTQPRLPSLLLPRSYVNSGSVLGQVTNYCLRSVQISPSCLRHWPRVFSLVKFQLTMMPYIKLPILTLRNGPDTIRGGVFFPESLVFASASLLEASFSCSFCGGKK